jgi:murein DD-endopeptidase MepM/ murein hydrolase activator NlpD
LTDRVLTYKEVLDKLERRIELTTASQSEVMEKIYDNKRIMKHTPSIWPVLGGKVKDRFGMRLHPITERVRMHKGIDIAAESGTEVFAAAAGVVVDAVLQKNGYGKHVIIDHGDGLVTLYGHLSKILVKKGDKIDRWNPIGLVGETGFATGPHLHYEVRRDDKAQDPNDYMLNMEQQ